MLRTGRLKGSFLVTWIGAMLVANPAAAQAGGFPALDAVTQRAEERAYDVIDSLGRLGTAQASGLGARMSSFGNPYLEVSAGQQRSAEVEADARLYLPIEVAGQRAARIAESERLVAYRMLGAREARARARGLAITAWGQVRALAAKLEQARQAETGARRESEWVAARQEVGAATMLDKSLAQAEVSRWAQTRAETELALQEAVARLCLVMGGGEVTLPDPAESVPVPPVLSYDAPQLLARALERSPALLAQRAEAGYWNAAGERARRERSAPVSLLVSGGRGDLGEPRVTGGIAWAFPVVRRNEGEIARADAERLRSVSLAETLQGLLEVRLRSGISILKTARDSLRSVDAEGIPAATQFAQAAEDSFRAGKTQLVQAIIARRDLANARTRRLDLIETMWRAYGDIVAITGENP